MQRAAVTTMLSWSARLVSGLLLVTLGGQAGAQDPATISPLPAIPIEARPIANPSATTQGSDAESQGEYARRPDLSHRARLGLDEAVQRPMQDRVEAVRFEPPSTDDPEQGSAKNQDGPTEHTRRPTDDNAVGSRKNCVMAGHTEHRKKKPGDHAPASAGCVHSARK